MLFLKIVSTQAVINTDDKLALLLSTLDAAEWIAVDTEADSLHAYPEKLCLLQISVVDRDELVDPLAGIDLNPLWALLRRHEIILHGADYDLRLLQRGFQFIPNRIFDTMLAARLLGYHQFSLVDLVRSKLDIVLEKGPQKMDWSRRPLTERMERYARNDTRYLKPLAELLKSELQTKGRLSWHQETCSRLITDATKDSPPDPDNVWRIRGSDKLGPRAMAILRELWHWREVEARNGNKPPYFILSHEIMVELARETADKGCIAPPLPSIPSRRQKTLATALSVGLELTESQFPNPRQQTGRRLSYTEQRRVEELRRLRDRRAAALQLPPPLLASKAALVSLALHGCAQTAGLMSWQQELLLDSKP